MANVQSERVVGDVLRELGIPPHLRGYRYLKTAILLVMKNPEHAYAITKKIYPEIAQLYGTTEQKVARAMRNAIEVAWLRGDLDVQHRYFGNTVSSEKGRPTNVEFLAVVSEWIR